MYSKLYTVYGIRYTVYSIKYTVYCTEGSRKSHELGSLYADRRAFLKRPMTNIPALNSDGKFKSCSVNFFEMFSGYRVANQATRNCNEYIVGDIKHVNMFLHFCFLISNKSHISEYGIYCSMLK